MLRKSRIGETVERPNWTRQAATGLRKRQHALPPCKRGSRRRGKARGHLAAAEEIAQALDAVPNRVCEGPAVHHNALGVSMTVPIATGGAFTRDVGLAVSITGHETTGVAVCNQVRSFEIAARVRAGSARFIEMLDKATMDEIAARVVSAIDPES